MAQDRERLSLVPRRSHRPGWGVGRTTLTVCVHLRCVFTCVLIHFCMCVFTRIFTGYDLGVKCNIVFCIVSVYWLALCPLKPIFMVRCVSIITSF